jgi:rubrerythrin
MQRVWKCTVCGYLAEGDEAPEQCPNCGAKKNRFILYERLTETLEKLVKDAFAGEAKASARNSAFADAADRDGFAQVARLFRAVADAERIHASEYLKYLEGVIGETEANLQTAFENELKAKNDIYPGLIQQAMRSNREDLANSFARARDAESQHADLYKETLNAMVREENVSYFVCQVCGNVFVNTPPEICPICLATKEEFRIFS